MVTSPVPVYLGCAGLIVGCLGLGAQHMLGGSSAPPAAVQEQPLFARSVEEAALPAARWPSQNPEVAFYEPMVELLTTPARTSEPSEPSQPVASNREEAQVSAPREIVRDVPREQVKQSSRRAKNARARNEAEPSDQRATRERGRQRAEAQDDAEEANVEPRRSGRRYRDRAESEPVDIRSRSERGGQRVIREETREPERYVQGPEQRESVGLSPFRLFGIFDQR